MDQGGVDQQSDGNQPDVLDSIRRLVEEETAEYAKQLEEKKAAEAPQPLILGSEQRVDTEQPLSLDEILSDDSGGAPGAADTGPSLVLGGNMSVPPRPAGAVANSSESPFFDEDALRELVSAMVQEELQGQLGERITRSIRKIVRREVLHVLDLTATGDEPPQT